ncbi:MAG: cytochrome c biogenesis protein ResB [Gracilibacteraceae bacterium]|jgi:cytochrome c biogenesis protein|nr:cytochrome c biogenesis protein ResB [Gracilibacteraceae bacterium]
MPERFWRFASSMPAGLALLGMIAAMAALGSFFWPGVFFRSPLFWLLFILLFVQTTFCGLSNLRRRRRLPRAAALFLIHAGVLLVLIGAAVNATFGLTATLTLGPGEEQDAAAALGLPGAEPLWLRLESFEITFYEDGSPSQYLARLSTRAGEESAAATVSVNHPLSLGGIKIYQQSFGYLFGLRVDGGEAIALRSGERIALGAGAALEPYRYIPAFDERAGLDTGRLRPDNPRIVYLVREAGGEVNTGLAAPGEETQAAGKTVLFESVEMYTVLRLKTDPGLIPAAVGVVMLMAGVCAGFAARSLR